MSGEVPVMGYEPGAAADTDRVFRGICAVGVIHGVACAVFVAQRAARWLAGGRDIFEQTQSANFAGVGLTAQATFGLMLAACCLVCIYRPSAGARSATAIVAALLGATWYAFGFADYLPSFFSFSNESIDGLMIAHDVINNVCRETNQALVPALIVFACTRPRSLRGLTRATQVVVVLSCLFYVEPLSEFIYAWAAADNVVWPTSPRRWGMACAFAIIGLLLAIGARPWRMLTALPLLAIVVKDVYLGGALGLSLLTSDLSFTVVTQITRQMSFLLIVCAPAIASLTIFTLLGAPPPGRRSTTLRAADVDG